MLGAALTTLGAILGATLEFVGSELSSLKIGAVPSRKTNSFPGKFSGKLRWSGKIPRLRADWGRQGLGCWEGSVGAGSGLRGGQGAPPKKKREGPFLRGRRCKKNGEADDTKMIPK